MATLTKAARAERAQIDKLRAMIKPGDTVYTILDHVSSSGMRRAIRVVVPFTRHEARYSDGWRQIDPGVVAITDTDHGGQLEIRCVADHWHPNYAVGQVLGLRHWKRNGREQDALVVGGCGMDMGFHLVESLSRTLYGGVHCDCGAWYDDARPGQRFTRKDFDARAGDADAWHYRHDPACPSCAGGGYLLTSGYACLGKGKCPSNYHVNHRDRVRCDGRDGRICWAPSSTWSGRDRVPEDWPRGPAIDLGEGATLPGPLLHCLHTAHDGAPYEVCPTCKGAGDLANPEGPERWDLRHFDGYAIRHRWL